MNRSFLFTPYICALLLIACTKKNQKTGGGGDIPTDWYVDFELVDSTGEYLYDSIMDLPFDTKKSYFLDAFGVKHSFIVHDGGPYIDFTDTIGVTLTAGKRNIPFSDLEGQMNQFTWLLHIDPTYSPDTFTVYNPLAGGRADSAVLNGILILPQDTIKKQLPHIIHLLYPHQ